MQIKETFTIKRILLLAMSISILLVYLNFMVASPALAAMDLPIPPVGADDGQGKEEKPKTENPNPSGGGGSAPSNGGGSTGGGGSTIYSAWTCYSTGTHGGRIRVTTRAKAKRLIGSMEATHCTRSVSGSGAHAWDNGTGPGAGGSSIPDAAKVAGWFQCGLFRNEEVIAGYKWSASWTENPYGRVTNPRANVTCVNYRSRSVTVKCYETTKGIVEKTTPNRKTLYPLSGNGVTNISGSGSNEYESCLNVRRAVVNTPGMRIDEFGRYRVHVNITYTPKTFLVFDNNPITGRAKAPIKKATGQRTSINKYSYAQLTCDPNKTGVGLNKNSIWTGNWTWTMTDCFNGSSDSKPFEYKCTYAGNTQINGRNGLNATIMRDGEDNPIAWRRPTLQANTRGQMKTSTMFLRTGTPWDIPKDLSHGNNNVKLSTTGGTSLFNKDNGMGWRDGLITDTRFTSTWASEEGKPTQITPTYKWEGKFNVQSIIITGFDPLTAEMRTTRTTIAVDSEAQCTGDRVSMNSVRAVDSLN